LRGGTLSKSTGEIAQGKNEQYSLSARLTKEYSPMIKHHADIIDVHLVVWNVFEVRPGVFEEYYPVWLMPGAARCAP
jgi:hypothetical protein